MAIARLCTVSFTTVSVTLCFRTLFNLFIQQEQSFNMKIWKSQFQYILRDGYSKFSHMTISISRHSNSEPHDAKVPDECPWVLLFHIKLPSVRAHYRGQQQRMAEILFNHSCSLWISYYTTEDWGLSLGHSMKGDLCVCVCVCVCVCIHTFTCWCVWEHSCVSVAVCVYFGVNRF